MTTSLRLPASVAPPSHPPELTGHESSTSARPRAHVRRRRGSNRLFGALILSLISALFLSACGNPRQKAAYEHAFAAEQQQQTQLTAESTASLIREYQAVIQISPGSGWAKKAQQRITELQARASAEELHKSVFQEHGVD